MRTGLHHVRDLLVGYLKVFSSTDLTAARIQNKKTKRVARDLG